MAQPKTNTPYELDLTNALDPRLESMSYSQEKLKWSIPKGCSHITSLRQNASSYSSNGITFNFNTQGEQTLIDRRIYIECQFQVTVSGVAPVGVYLLADGVTAPRAFPLASVCDTLTLGINGGSVSVAYADAMAAMLRYCNEHDLKEYDLSGTPTMLDKFAVYSEGSGSLKSPLNAYASSGYETGRGAFRLDSITNPVGDGATTKNAVIKFTVFEPLIISPLLYSSQKLESGLIGVSNLSVQLQFSNLARVISGYAPAGVTISSVTAVVQSGTTEIPKLHLSYLSVPLSDQVQIPKIAVYDYVRQNVNQSDQSVTLAPGASQTFTNNAMQVNIVPKSITIYAAVPRGSKAWTDTDTFFRIDSLSLQYLNVSGQFSNMTSHDLYEMSVKNGLKLSYQEFNGVTTDYLAAADVGLVGSVIRIDCTDLALPDNLAPGCPISSQLQYQLTITNTSSASRAVALYTIISYEGLMSISEGTMITQEAMFSSSDVLETRTNKKWVQFQSQEGLYGGSFWDKFKSFGKKILSGAEKAISYAPKVADIAEKALPYVQAAKEMAGSGVVGGRKGKGLVGGRKMGRGELRALMEA